MQSPPPIIYRFSERIYLEPMRTAGIIRFTHARKFKDSTLATAQADDEQRRQFILDPLHHQFLASSTSSSVQPLTNVFKMELNFDLVGRTGKPLDYYIFCTSLAFNRRFYPEFQANSCLCFRDPKQLSLRLMTTCRRRFTGCDFYARDCWYYDPSHLPATTNQCDLLFWKKHDFGWQQEFRFIFAIAPELSRADYIEFCVGNLDDICDFYDES